MSYNIWKGKGIVKIKKQVVIRSGNKSYEVTDISLSTKRIVKGEAKYTLVPLEAWGDMSKLFNDIEQEDLIEVEGRFENKKWKNKDKIEQTKNLIVVEKVHKV